MLFRSGLDVTTQEQISRLILALVRETGTAALSISHDLALLATVCDDIAIMYAGEIVERGPANRLYWASRHPYTAALVDAVPRVDDERRVVGLPGLPPAHVVSDRCGFADRCRFAQDPCLREHPTLVTIEPGHDVRCLRTLEIGVPPSQRLHAGDVESVHESAPILEIGRAHV